ncbi:MAG: hypothetical protein J6R88_03555 [Clostridia bacterium]|nr:hypothetical protein [Clostridia bacterium]
MSKSSKPVATNTIKLQKIKKICLRALKIIALLALFVVSYAISYYLNGFEETNKKLITLLVLGVAGYVLFYVIYTIFYVITKIKLSLKNKRATKNVVNCDEEAAKIMQNQKYQFNFDTNLTFNDNLNSYLSQTVVMVEDVANVYSIGGKYAFLNYTVYDAIDVVSNAIDVLHDKIDGFLTSKALVPFKFYDKPISFVSSELNKLIYEEEKTPVIEEEVKPKKTSAIKEKLMQIGAKAGKTVLRKPINNLANSITEFFASESVRVYGKNGKMPKKIKEKK